MNQRLKPLKKEKEEKKDIRAKYNFYGNSNDNSSKIKTELSENTVISFLGINQTKPTENKGPETICTSPKEQYYSQQSSNVIDKWVNG